MVKYCEASLLTWVRILPPVFNRFFNPRRRAVFELWNVTYHTNVLYHREWSIMTNDLIYKFQQGKIILLCDCANFLLL